MANVKLTERQDGTFYLQCRCGEIGQLCRYEGEIVSVSREDISLLRQARNEAFEHCWTEHRVPAWNVSFDISRYQTPANVSADLRPFLVTTEPVKAVLEQLKKKAGAGS